MLPLVDPEIAAATLRTHLDEYWANRDRDASGWRREWIDQLHVVVRIPARLPEVSDWFYVKVGAEYYDLNPPTVLFVTPEAGWPRARQGTRWWPQINNPEWFQLHDDYGFPSGPGQLVCCSVTAEYYMSRHTPQPAQRWEQGNRTVAATLSRLAEVLSPPRYLGRDG